MSSRSDRKTASKARFWSRPFACFYDLDKVQYLDVQVRTQALNGNPVELALIRVFQAGTTNLVTAKITDRYGDAIIRLAPGNYKVRAQKAWYTPDSVEQDNQALARRAALVVPLNVQPVQYFLHVDADRNGVIDDQTEAPIDTAAPAWAWGANRRGAILPVNVDDDDASGASDAADNTVNGNADRDSDIAHIEIRRHGNVNAPNTWTANLSIGSPAGELNPENNVRIFDGVAGNSNRLLGANFGGVATNQSAVNNFAANPCRLGIEATRYAGNDFNGIVSVRLTLTCPNPLGGGNLTSYTEAQMRAASWIMPNHLQRADTVYVSRLDVLNGNGESDTFIAALDPFVTAVAPNGAGGNLVESNQIAGQDPWVQDCMEIGYSTWPGTRANLLAPVSIKRMETVMRAYRTGEPLYAYPQTLRGVNFGFTSPGQGVSNDFDSTGNLEVTPPVRALAGARHNAGGVGGKDYNWGRIYYGRGRGIPGHVGTELFNQETREFLEAQTVQHPIALNTAWLSVGHVDEMMSFVPSPGVGKGWKLLIASPQEAYTIIGTAPPASVVMNGRNLHYGPANTTAGTMMNAAALASTIPNPAGGVLTWQELRDWNLNQIQPLLTAILNDLVNEIDLSIANDVITVPIVFRPEYPVGAIGVAPLTVQPGTIGGFIGGALTAGMVNMLVINNHLVIPKPFGPEVVAEQTVANPTGDLFIRNLSTKITNLNNAMPNNADHLHPHYIDDWDLYHANMGEVHCGTNTLRKPANVGNWCANNAQARWWEFPG